MTTYVLALSGNEERAANATHWAKVQRAKLISVSRNPAAAGAPAGEREGARLPFGRDAGTLAALLVRTLDTQDGLGIVLADFDSEEFAADVVARIAALGRSVTCTGQVAAYGLRARLRRRFS